MNADKKKYENVSHFCIGSMETVKEGVATKNACMGKMEFQNPVPSLSAPLDHILTNAVLQLIQHFPWVSFPLTQNPLSNTSCTVSVTP